MLYEDDYEVDAKPKTSLDLWKFFVKQCNIFYDGYTLPKKPEIKILSQLKRMLEAYGYSRCLDYIAYAVANWDKLVKEFSLGNQRYPNISIIYVYRYSGMAMTPIGYAEMLDI